MHDRDGNRLIHGRTAILGDRLQSTRTAFRNQIRKYHGRVWISVGSSVEATGMKGRLLSGWRSGNDRFHSSSGCKQHVAQPSAADLGLVEGKGHSVQGDDVKGAAVDLEIT